jgi:hypothetical protein
MRIFGWIVFSIGIILGLLLLPLMRNVALISTPGGYVMIDKSVPTWILFVPLICIILGSWLGISKPKTKRLVCPNGCNAVQQGTNYCGLCGTRLVRR